MRPAVKGGNVGEGNGSALQREGGTRETPRNAQCAGARFVAVQGSCFTAGRGVPSGKLT